MNVTRVTGDRLYEIKYQLTPTQLTIIDTLAIVRVATSKQIERLHFTTGTQLSRVRMRNLALRRLIDLGILVRWRKPNGGLGGGSDAYCYALDRAGQRIANPEKTHYWREPYPSAPFLAHRLAITELYVACQQEFEDGFKLEKFQSEPTCWRKVPSRWGGKPDLLRPDAYMVLANENTKCHRYIEIDMGTERMDRIGEKVKVYCEYLCTGLAKKRHNGFFPRVMFLVLDTPRKTSMAAYMRDYLRKLSPHADLSHVFAVELQENAYPVLGQRFPGVGSS